jgi:hypothetical protein
MSPRYFRFPAQFADSNASPKTDLPAAPISNPGRNMVKDSLTVQHHFDRGSDNDTFNDPSDWRRASYESHPVDSMEPLPDIPNPYREAALHHMRLMYACDEFITAAPDARLAVVAVAVVLGWPSTRGLSIGNIADQLGVSVVTIRPGLR